MVILAFMSPFGSLKFGGRLSIGDAYPQPGKPPVQSRRNGVGIDRYTGGTVKGVLFDLVVIEGGVFEAHLRVQNFELWQLAAVNFLVLGSYYAFNLSAPMPPLSR